MECVSEQIKAFEVRECFFYNRNIATEAYTHTHIHTRRPAMVHLVAIGRVGDALALLAAHDAMQHGGVGGGGGMGDNSSSSSMLMDGSGYRGSAPPASVLPQVNVCVWVDVGFKTRSPSYEHVGVGTGALLRLPLFFLRWMCGCGCGWV